MPVSGVFLGEEEPPRCCLSLADEMREGGRGRAIRDSLIFSRWTLLGRCLGGRAGPAGGWKSLPKMSCTSERDKKKVIIRTM